MDVYEAIRRRVAVKEFKPDPIPDATLRKILLAARWAPSQRNRQPWHFVVVRDPETRAKLASLTSSGPFIAEAPVAIAVAIDGARMPQFEAGRAMENMVLTAWAEGVGTTMVGGFDKDAVKAVLGIPGEMELITVMPFGYPTDDALARGKRRKSLDEVAHLERFGDPYR
jgi:nitroreductase